MRTESPGHLKKFSYLGLYRYSLTFCTDQRRHVFTSHETVDLVLEQILRAARENLFDLLIEGRSESSDCLRFVASAKQYSGFYYSKTFRRRLWQRYGYEHVLRDDEATMVVARYILDNPRRGGLVERVEDYPFIGSLMYDLRHLLDGVAEAG